MAHLVTLPVVRGAALAVFAGGIAGMISTTIATDNNNGWVASFGLVSAAASVVLIAVAASWRAATERGVPPGPPAAPPVDEALAETLEARVTALVSAGVPEEEVRALVRDAVRLGRSGTGTGTG